MENRKWRIQNRRIQNVCPIIDFPFAILNSLFLIPGSPDGVAPGNAKVRFRQSRLSLDVPFVADHKDPRNPTMPCIA